MRPTPASKNGKDVEKPSYGPLALPMLAYIGSQGLVYVCAHLYLVNADIRLALGLWKCSTMGILPTGFGDWLQFETRSEVSRYVRGVDLANDPAARVVFVEDIFVRLDWQFWKMSSMQVYNRTSL